MALASGEGQYGSGEGKATGAGNRTRLQRAQVGEKAVRSAKPGIVGRYLQWERESSEPRLLAAPSN